MPELVYTITGRTMDDVRRARDSAHGADIVEVRLDGVARPDARAALDGRRHPVIVTCRPKWEGGAFDGSEEERRRLLLAAVDAGAEWIDVEFEASFSAELIRARRGRGVVVSAHRFGAAEPDAASRLSAMRATGAEVCKLAVEVQSLSDTLPLFALGRGSQSAGRDHVLIAMGRHGVHTRILAARLGSKWCYGGEGIAPGQLPVSRLLREFQFRRITADATLYGIVGSPVGHSLSPAMHNTGFVEAGVNAAFATFEPKDVEDFVRFARALGLAGASVTAPFKVDVLSHVDERDPLVSEVGAMNTLLVRGERWRATNTDVAGFLAPLTGRLDLQGVRAAVLGAGGAARAVAIALRNHGAAVSICARRPEAARAVADAAGVSTAPFPPPKASWDLLVNATPVGSRSGDGSPMNGASLDGHMVYDLIYSPAVTPLLGQAQRAGLRTIGGIEMLVAQAERQFELWTGAAPPPGLFRRTAEAALRRRTGAAD